MATIQSVLEFQDKMSATIAKISKSLDVASANAEIAKVSLGNLEKQQQEWKTTLDAARKSNSKNAENVKIAEQRYKEATQQVKTAKDELRKYEQEAQKAQSKIDAVAKAQSKFNKVLDDSKGKFNIKELSLFGITLGNVLGNFATRAIDFLTSSIGQAIERASDLAEVQNVVDVAFGNSAEKVNQWAQNTLNQFGLNELSAKRYAGTMGAMLKSSGLTGQAVDEMSMRIAELSGDVASFYNLNPEEAFSKLRAGISGVTMPLKEIGIDMSVANLKAFAMSQGIKTSYEKMSEAGKMAIRYQYLLQATKDAQGDFERTSGSFANQQKLMQENWANLSAAIANMFVPALAKGMQIINSAMQAGMKFIDVLNALAPVIIGVGTAIFITQIPALATLAKQYIIAGTQATIAGIKMAAAWLMALGPIGLIIVAVGAVIGIFTALILKNQTVAKSFWGIVSAIDTALTKFAQWRNRGDAEKVAELQAGLDKRIADREKRVESIRKKGESANGGANKAKTPFAFDPSVYTTAGTSGGKAIKTKQQGSISIDKDNLDLMHDLATREYAQYFQQLTPNLTIPSMVIHETADVNQVIGAVASAITGSVSSSTSGGFATA